MTALQPSGVIQVCRHYAICAGEASYATPKTQHTQLLGGRTLAAEFLVLFIVFFIFSEPSTSARVLSRQSNLPQGQNNTQSKAPNSRTKRSKPGHLAAEFLVLFIVFL